MSAPWSAKPADYKVMVTVVQLDLTCMAGALKKAFDCPGRKNSKA